MMTEKKNRKHITLRLDEKLLERIEKFSKKNKQYRSITIRIAIEDYLYLHNDESPNPLLVWGKKEMIEIFKLLSEETIKKLAEIGYQHSKESYEPMKIKKKLNTKEEKTVHCKKMLGILKNVIYRAKGYNWFNDIHEKWDGPNDSNLKLAGIHDLGYNFSLYIKYRTINHMKPYDYVLVGENLLENKVILDFQQMK